MPELQKLAEAAEDRAADAVLRWGAGVMKNHSSWELVLCPYTDRGEIWVAALDCTAQTLHMLVRANADACTQAFGPLVAIWEISFMREHPKQEGDIISAFASVERLTHGIPASEVAVAQRVPIKYRISAPFVVELKRTAAQDGAVSKPLASLLVVRNEYEFLLKRYFYEKLNHHTHEGVEEINNWLQTAARLSVYLFVTGVLVKLDSAEELHHVLEIGRRTARLIGKFGASGATWTHFFYSVCAHLREQLQQLSPHFHLALSIPDPREILIAVSDNIRHGETNAELG